MRSGEKSHTWVRVPPKLSRARGWQTGEVQRLRSRTDLDAGSHLAGRATLERELGSLAPLHTKEAPRRKKRGFYKTHRILQKKRNLWLVIDRTKKYAGYEGE